MRAGCMQQVPGEMFALAMEAKKRGMGVVGSTQNILDFIAAKLAEAVDRPFPDTLQVRSATPRSLVGAVSLRARICIQCAEDTSQWCARTGMRTTRRMQ